MAAEQITTGRGARQGAAVIDLNAFRALVVVAPPGAAPAGRLVSWAPEMCRHPWPCGQCAGPSETKQARLCRLIDELAEALGLPGDVPMTGDAA